MESGGCIRAFVIDGPFNKEAELARSGIIFLSEEIKKAAAEGFIKKLIACFIKILPTNVMG